MNLQFEMINTVLLLWGLFRKSHFGVSPGVQYVCSMYSPPPPLSVLRSFSGTAFPLKFDLRIETEPSTSKRANPTPLLLTKDTISTAIWVEFKIYMADLNSTILSFRPVVVLLNRQPQFSISIPVICAFDTLTNSNPALDPSLHWMVVLPGTIPTIAIC